jgi:hypothetical protein
MPASSGVITPGDTAVTLAGAANASKIVNRIRHITTTNLLFKSKYNQCRRRRHPERSSATPASRSNR